MNETPLPLIVFAIMTLGLFLILHSIKALYNSENDSESNLLKILNPVINSDSVWKSHALLLMADYFANNKNLMKSKMLIQVHDELIFEVAPGELMELSMMMNEIMPSAIKLDVPVLVDIKTGDSWGKLE